MLDGLQSATFVAENVAGLAKGVAKGYLKDIIRKMTACGYKVKVGTLDAQWLGVPQRRKRLIFMGVRNDLGTEPRFPKPLPYRYSVADACPWLVNGERAPHVEPESSIAGDAIGREALKLKPGEQSERYNSLVRMPVDGPSQTINTLGSDTCRAGVIHPTELRRLSIAELRRICGFPDDFQLVGTYSQQWERLGRAVPPPMMAAVACQVRSILDDVAERR